MNMKEMKTENGTEKKEDRRVRRTKKLLSQGLIELMQHKQVKDITVRELAALREKRRLIQRDDIAVFPLRAGFDHGGKVQHIHVFVV